MVLVALDAVMRPAPDKCAECIQELQQDRGGVGFGVRLDHPNGFAGDSVERFGSQRLRPLLAFQIAFCHVLRVGLSFGYLRLAVPCAERSSFLGRRIPGVCKLGHGSSRV